MRFLVGFEQRVRRLRRSLSPWLYAGSQVYCPFCDRSYRKFRPAGRRKFRRLNAVCPVCGSRERDRFLHYFLRKQSCLQIPKAVLLHVAPEPCLQPSIQELGESAYISCDLLRTDVDVQLNVEQMPFLDESLDIVFCGHVLPEVENDRRAVAEIYRILKRTGWALVSVQSYGETTIEVRPGDGNEAPPEFFRIYGADFESELATQGFDVQRVAVSDVLDDQLQRRMRVSEETVGGIYILRKSQLTYEP